jgi:hypothetical protein
MQVGFCGEDAPRAMLPTAMATATTDENREDEAAPVGTSQDLTRIENDRNPGYDAVWSRGLMEFTMVYQLYLSGVQNPCWLMIVSS